MFGLVVCVGVLFVSLTISQRTWSGGYSGISLNGTEFIIYEANNINGGVFEHFWVTGGNKTWIDNAIVSFYIDGENIPSISFQVNMACGVGFVDNTEPCTIGNCPEKYVN